MKLFAFIFLFATSVLAESQPRSITIGLIPGGSPENVKNQGMELAQVLQKELGIGVNMYVSKDYAGLVEAMKSKKVDFAFFSSMTFVKAEKEAKAKVLLKKVWANPFYFSAIVVRKDSKVRKIEDLKGKSIVFVDTNSSSGYLYPKVILQKKKLDEKDFKEVRFSGNHSQSVSLLENKEVDAAALFADDAKGAQGAWTKFGKSPKSFRVLWVSEPIPNDPFCVRQDFYDKYPKLTHTLMFTLIEVFEKNRDSERFSEVLGVKDLIPATSRQYDPVREMVNSLQLGSN